MAFTNRPRVVIVGAGFAGLAAARALTEAALNAPPERRPHVLLVDRNNYHTFSPLLYRVATSAFEPQEIAFPIRPLARSLPGVELHVGQVQQLDLEGREITTADRSISYDYLLLAMGSAPQMNVPGAAESGLPIRTLEHAVVIRNQVLRTIEQASQMPDAVEVRRLLTFVIVGGGMTGVEFASALVEFIRGFLPRHYPGLEAQARIMLMESGPRLLPEFADDIGGYAHARLRRMGVQVLVSTRAAEITPQGVYLRRGMLVPAATVIWAGGVRGNFSGPRGQLPASRSGQVSVLPTLQIPGFPDAYVAGDLAQVDDEGRPRPMTAAVAQAQGRSAARNIWRQARGQSAIPWSASPSDALVTLGRRSAAGERGSRSVVGLAAWMLWAGRGLPGLIPSRRLPIFGRWFLKHLQSDSKARIILPAEPELGLEQLELFDGSQTR